VIEALRKRNLNDESNSAKGVLITAMAAVLIIYFALFVQFKRHSVSGVRMPDFSCFYNAGRMVISGDRTRLYDFALQASYDARLQAELVHPRYSVPLLFVFPPFTLLIFAPLAFLPYAQAFAAWYALNVGMLLAVPFLLRGILKFGNKSLSLVVLMTPFFLPIPNALGQGQVSILLLLLFTLAFRDLVHGRELRAGCMLALATFKPQFVLPFLLVLALTRNWKVLRGFFATCSALFGVSIAIVGWKATLSSPRAMVELGRLPWKLGGEIPVLMFNLRGFACNYLGSQLSNHALRTGTLAASAALVFLALVPFLDRRCKVSAVSLSLILAVTLLASYHAYVHDMSLLLLPFLVMASYIAETELTPLRLAIALTGGSPFIITSIYPPWFPICLLLFSVTLFLETLRINTSDLPVKIKELRPACVAGATR